MLFPFPTPERLRRFEERDEAGETGVSMTGLDWEVLIVELALDGRLEEFLDLVVFGGLDGEVIESIGFFGSEGLSGFSGGAEVGPELDAVALSSRVF